MPNNWKKYKLGEIVVQPRDITYGVVQPGKASIDGIPIVKVNNITSKDFSKSNMEKVTKEIEEKYTRSRLQGNEILISLVGSLGYLCKVEKGMIGWNVARAVGVLPIKEEFNRDWIFFYLRGPQAQHELKTIATTSVQATINLKDLKGLEIPYPSISEIDSITEILSSLDDKIELNLQTNKTLEEMANALYKHWFVDFGPFKDGKFVESELGMIPEGWEVANLGDVVDIGSSKRIFLNEYVSSGIPFYRGKEIIELSKNNSINTELFIENEKFEEIKVKFGAPKEGDILLTSVGNNR
jgi:type I restriction enzyme S subunit